MKRCELLSPAGNMEMLKYAISYGADAVYLAGSRFGARKYANNFDEKEMVEAVNYAHQYGVKVYVTINTLIYDDETEDFIHYVNFINSIHVDAVLVQDLGMMSLIHRLIPDLEIHSSTQFHNDGQKTLDFLKDLGVKRAVLDREMTLEEIKNLKTDLELEVFIHGALCVSYSGQCLLSSYILNRSGNRGECAGLCRLPYKKDEDENYHYYLSLKDLFAKESVYDLIDAGVSSLKIEGRMKSPEYVGYITHIYRSLIDSYYDGSKRSLDGEEIRNIMLLYNRGMTSGFMKNTPSDDIVNLTSPNHIGIPLGTYKPLKKDKVELKLEMDLRQGDTIRFREDDKAMVLNFLYDKKDNLINRASSGQIVYVDNFLGLTTNGHIRLVASKSLKDEIDTLPKRTVPINMSFSAHLEENISLVVEEAQHCTKIMGPPAELAKKSPITKEDIERQLKKTGDTVYKVDDIDINLDKNLFINLKDINELRRTALLKLDSIRSKKTSTKPITFIHKPVNTVPCTPQLIITVETESQYHIAKQYTNLIFTSNRELLRERSDIYPKYVDCNCQVTRGRYMICDYGLLMNRHSNDEIYSDYMMNVTNSFTAEFLVDAKVTGVGLSVELDLKKLETFAKFTDMSKTCFLIYGRLELMKMKYNLFHSKPGHLIDQYKNRYYVKSDEHYNYLMSPKPIDYCDKLKELCELNIGYYRLDFTDESKEMCKKILEKTHKFVYQE